MEVQMVLTRVHALLEDYPAYSKVWQDSFLVDRTSLRLAIKDLADKYRPVCKRAFKRELIH